MSKQNIRPEEFLESAGFIKTGLVVMKDDKGHETAPYMRATTKMGDLCYIELNSNDPLSIERIPDRIKVSIKTGSVISNPTKMTIAECSNGSVCGVALECDNELCMVSHTDDNKDYSEINLSVLSEMPTKSHHVRGWPVAYPMIRYTDICSSDKCIDNIHQVAKHIRCKMIYLNQSNIINLMKEVGDMNANLSFLASKYHLVYEALTKELEFLECSLEKWSCCPKTCDSIAMEASLIKEYRNRQAFFTGISLDSMRVNSLHPEISRISNHISRTYAHLYLKARKNLDVCSDQFCSKTIMTPEAWGYPAEMINYQSEIDCGKWPCILDSWIEEYVKSGECDLAKRLEFLKLAVLSC